MSDDPQGDYDRKIRNDPEFQDFERRAREQLIPKMAQSQIMVTLLPENDQFDIKWCVELGMSIMMDKPIIAVVYPGRKVPSKLVLIADEIVEMVGGSSFLNDDAVAKTNAKAIRDAMDRVAARRDGV